MLWSVVSDLGLQCLPNWLDVLSTSLRKKFFAWLFILNENLISDWQCLISGTVCSFGAFFSNIYCKINLMAKIGSDLCNIYSKLDFWKNFIRNIFFLFFAFFMDFKVLMFHNNIMKTSVILNKGNLLKICFIYLPHQFLHKCVIFLKPVNRIKLFVYTVTTHGFS